jgi:hypothetical protein
MSQIGDSRVAGGNGAGGGAKVVLPVTALSDIPRQITPSAHPAEGQALEGVAGGGGIFDF